MKRGRGRRIVWRGEEVRRKRGKEKEEEEEESLFKADAVNEDSERDRATQVQKTSSAVLCS